MQHPNTDIDAFYQRFKKRVLRILQSKKGKQALDSLTAKLIQTGLLSGCQAVAIIERAWGRPLPKRALPSSQHGDLFIGGPQNYFDLIRELAVCANVMDSDIESLRGRLSDTDNDRIEMIKQSLLGLRLTLKQ